MNILNEVQKLAERKTPNLKVGHTVRVHQTVKEGEKERVQIFEGLVIKVNSGHGADKTFRVRKVVEGIGVEKVFPICSPLIKKIELKKKSKIRRAKLYYMRDRSGKSARLKESFLSSAEFEKEVEEVAKQKAKEEALEAVETTEVTEEVETPEVVEETPKEVAEAPETPVAEAPEEEAPKEA